MFGREGGKFVDPWSTFVLMTCGLPGATSQHSRVYTRRTLPPSGKIVLFERGLCDMSPVAVDSGKSGIQRVLGNLRRRLTPAASSNAPGKTNNRAAGLTRNSNGIVTTTDTMDMTPAVKRNFPLIFLS